MNPIEELKSNIDFKNLSHSDLVFMYDLLLSEFPYIQGNTEATLNKMREIYGVNLTERHIMSITDVDLNTEIEDLKLYANK